MKNSQNQKKKTIQLTLEDLALVTEQTGLGHWTIGWKSRTHKWVFRCASLPYRHDSMEAITVDELITNAIAFIEAVRSPINPTISILYTYDPKKYEDWCKEKEKEVSL